MPYKGGAPALADLVAGRLTYSIEGPVIQLPQVKAGRLRALAVTSGSGSPPSRSCRRSRSRAFPATSTSRGSESPCRPRRPRPSSRNCTPTCHASCARPNRGSTSPRTVQSPAARRPGVRRLHPRRACEMGQGRARSRDQGGVGRMTAQTRPEAMAGADVGTGGACPLAAPRRRAGDVRPGLARAARSGDRAGRPEHADCAQRARAHRSGVPARCSSPPASGSSASSRLALEFSVIEASPA